MAGLKEVVERIEFRLREVGLSAAGASKAAGLSPDAIRNMQRAVTAETGRINPGASTATLRALAPVLETTVAWLTGAEDAKKVNVVGYVGAGAEAHFHDVGQGSLDEVDAPENATAKTVAVIIRGESLGALFNNWLVFYDDVRDPPGHDLIGRMCVCGLADGRVLIKGLKQGHQEGLWNLFANVGEPIYDVELVWAAEVKDMRRP